MSQDPSSNLDVVTNVNQPSIPSKLEINYTHHHILSFSSKDTSMNDIKSEFQNLTTAIIASTPGKLVQLVPNVVGCTDAAVSRPKAIIVNDKCLTYTAETLPDPPALSYKTRAQLEQLVKDWDSSSFLIIDGVGIPICYWQKLYSRTRPNAWKRIKDQWTKYKFIVGGFKSFESSKAFWEHMSLATAKGERVPNLTFKVISIVLRQMRSDQDREDAEAAKTEYKGAQFSSLFSYRKGGRQFVMKKPQDIARLYRRLKKRPVYWDDEMDIDSDTEENG